MNAADLFKKAVSEEEEKRNSTPYYAAFKNYWTKTHSNFKTKDFLTILGTFFIFLTIPLTVFVSFYLRDIRSQAKYSLNVLQVENFRQIKLTYSPKQNSLNLISKSLVSSLPLKVGKKTSRPGISLTNLHIVQLNKFGKPIFTFDKEIEVEVNKEGKPLNNNYDFSVQLIDSPGKAQFSLGGKKLLEVGL